MNGLMTICHDARKGGYTGSHWPKSCRASALLDPQFFCLSFPPSFCPYHSAFLLPSTRPLLHGGFIPQLLPPCFFRKSEAFLRLAFSASASGVLPSFIVALIFAP